MNYRHAYHAGNFADVLKHTALVCVLAYLAKKDKPFAVIDTHGGRGLYDLKAEEAAKTGEAEGGVLRLLDGGAAPDVVAAYLDVVRGFGGAYPGSPLIAQKMLRDTDRLTVIEKHPEEYDALVAALKRDARTRAIHGDAYRELSRFVPPRERRGVVLIDPPYENAGEFKDAVAAIIAAHRRFATGIYLFWYPAKDRAAVSAAAGEMLNAGIKSLLRAELDIGKVAADRAPLSATGLYAVNPPFGFAGDMERVLPFLAAHLAHGPGASWTLDRLAGES